MSISSLLIFIVFGIVKPWWFIGQEAYAHDIKNKIVNLKESTGTHLKLSDVTSSVLKSADQGTLIFTESKNSAPFEGGNIGYIRKKSADEFEVSLRSDNDDALPEFWRKWWFFKLEDVPTDRPVTITLVGAGQWAYYLPVFAYEGIEQKSGVAFEKLWRHFNSTDVTQPTKLTVKIRHRFSQSRVYLARFVPYTLNNLMAYLRKIALHPLVKLNIAGYSWEGRAMPVISIGTGDVRQKKAIFVHARTHPGEVGSSFLLEGFIDQILNSKEALFSKLRNDYVIEILPMLNVDGVYIGNNRVTPGGINLEGKWYPKKIAEANDKDALKGESSMAVDKEKAPKEVLVWHNWIMKILQNGAEPVAALNLHSSSVMPKEGLFSFPHFGPVELGYSPLEARLFESQKAFMNFFRTSLGKEWFLPFTEDGGRHFTLKNLPESWWWQHFGPQVMALTIESTYGLAPEGNRWILPEDLRRIGRAMASGMARYGEELNNKNRYSH